MIYHFGNYDLEDLFENGGFPKIHHVSHLKVKKEQGYQAMHSHMDRLEMIYVVEGDGLHTIGKKSYHTCPGDLIIFNQGVPHEERAYQEGTMKFYGCAVTGMKIKGMKENQLTQEKEEPILHMREEDEFIRNIFSTLFRECASENIMQRYICSQLAAVLIMKILEWKKIKMKDLNETSENEKKDGEIVREVLEYLDKNYREKIGLTQIAKTVGVSPYYLDRIFKSHTGTPIKQYIINRRLGRAQSLLTDTDYSIAQIAEMVGYDDPSYFGQLFKKKFSMAPGEYWEKLKVIRK